MGGATQASDDLHTFPMEMECSPSHANTLLGLIYEGESTRLQVQASWWTLQTTVLSSLNHCNPGPQILLNSVPIAQ